MCRGRVWLVAGTVRSVISSDRSPVFSLAYDLEPGDLRDGCVAAPGRRSMRTQAAIHLGAWGFVAVVLTLVTVALNEPTMVKDSAGAPGWMYAVDTAGWLLAARGIRPLIWLSPRQMTRRAWRAHPELHGRHRDDVTDLGITWIAPDGMEVFTPWSAVTGISETDRAFHLLDDHGDVRHELPKRGLASPDLIPPLRQFMNQAVDTPRPATGPTTPGQ